MTDANTERGEALKPCPFCGGVPELNDYTTAPAAAWVLVHRGKGCFVSPVVKNFPTREAAIAAWNRRAAPTEAKQVSRNAEDPCYGEHQPGCDCIIPDQVAAPVPAYLDRLASRNAGEGERFGPDNSSLANLWTTLDMCEKGLGHKEGLVCVATETFRDMLTALAARPASVEDEGWIVGNANADQWRTWKDGYSAWTEDRDKATRYARREDAEAVHQDDEGAWRVVPYRPLQAEARKGRNP
jgi:hypothetical protein